MDFEREKKPGEWVENKYELWKRQRIGFFQQKPMFSGCKSSTPLKFRTSELNGFCNGKWKEIDFPGKTQSD